MLFRIFPRQFRTLKGESVYSAGEKLIADFLYTSKIRYQYEITIKLGERKYHPDFYLPDHSIYIEYLGMIADPEYAYVTQLKKMAYHRYNLNVIYIIPQHLNYVGTIINQWIQYKAGKIQETAYIRLCKEVPKPLSREWVENKKRQIHNTPHFSSKKIPRTFLTAKYQFFSYLVKHYLSKFHVAR